MTERKVVICCGFGSESAVFSPQPPLGGQRTPGTQRGEETPPNCSQRLPSPALPVKGSAYL